MMTCKEKLRTQKDEDGDGCEMRRRANNAGLGAIAAATRARSSRARLRPIQCVQVAVQALVYRLCIARAAPAASKAAFGARKPV